MSSPLLINYEENNVESCTENENNFDETLGEQSTFEADRNDCNQFRQQANPYLMQWLESRGKNQKFRFNAFIEFYENAKVSKCLIKSCDRLLSKQNAGNIKRHYRRVHSFVILHGRLNPFPEGETDSSNLDKYFLYDPVTNKSSCKVPDCAATFDGKHPSNMYHFRSGHNYKTSAHDWMHLCRLKYIRTKLPLNELITYDKQTATYQCLFLNCNFKLKKSFYEIEKHYYQLHSIIFFKYFTCSARSLYQIDNEGKEILQQQITADNSQDEFISDDEQSANESNSKKKPRKMSVHHNRIKLFVNYYVNYCKKTNVSKCLIQNCGRRMKGLSPFNIQRHYDRLHGMLILSFYRDLTVPSCTSKDQLGNFVSYSVIVDSYQCLFINCHDNLKKDAVAIRNHYYEKHEIILNKKKTKEFKGFIFENDNEPQFSKSLIKAADSPSSVSLKILSLEHFVLTNYVDLNEEENVSKCLIKNCLDSNDELKDEQNIKKHYWKKHNIHIGLNPPSEYEEQEDMNINDFVFYDQENSVYKCLFITCNTILQNCLSNLKQHYHEKHMVIIGISSEETSGRKRRLNYHYESESSENDSISIINETLSDEEKPLQIKKKLRRFSIESSDNEATQLCSIKKEFSNETVEAEFIIAPVNCSIRGECVGATPMSSNHLRETSTILDITLTKQRFLKSCFGLLIQHDLNLNLFDDNVFFKHLLSPYEEIISFHLNAKQLMDFMLKAKDIIVDLLKETFCQRIVCLELFVVGREKKNYVIINVRLIFEKSIRNNLIGFLPINKTGKETLSFSEYLSKFNIDKQQVYMTTILADFQNDDEETLETLNNICEHNSNIKKHPLHYIQILYRSFVQKYSNEIRTWLKLTNNKDTTINTNVFNNLKDLQKQMENLSETDIDLKPDSMKELKLFMKTLQTFKNFMEKLNEELYVAGDFYRDLLCFELELKGEHKKNNNTYAEKLYEDLMVCKSTLMQSNEFMAALYLDARFNFLVGSRLLSDEQKMKGKLFLRTLWERFSNHLQLVKSQIDPLSHIQDCQKDLNVADVDVDDDDEYALLNQHINDIQPVKSNVMIDDLITNCVPAKREPFNLDILKYWHSKRQDMEDINELAKIAFAFSSSQYILNYLKEHFLIYHHDIDKIDKFLIKHNQNILDNNLDLLFQNIK